MENVNLGTEYLNNRSNQQENRMFRELLNEADKELLGEMSDRLEKLPLSVHVPDRKNLERDFYYG